MDGEIWIPDIVRAEFLAGRSHARGAIDLSQFSWIGVRAPSPDPKLSTRLDAGEAAAITLARDFGARLILLDERYGRREAMRLGLPIAGSLAVIVAAKEKGLVSAGGPILNQFIAQGRWIGDTVRAQILNLTGEE